ncbi:hypothetical protein [Hoeflea sp.]|uniref:hypothetical protein n=1 Tax=Hoeflea sp. TaxID=1940281 RepID=UPI0032EFE8DA
MKDGNIVLLCQRLDPRGTVRSPDKEFRTLGGYQFFPPAQEFPFCRVHWQEMSATLGIVTPDKFMFPELETDSKGFYRLRLSVWHVFQGQIYTAVASTYSLGSYVNARGIFMCRASPDID